MSSVSVDIIKAIDVFTTNILEIFPEYSQYVKKWWPDIGATNKKGIKLKRNYAMIIDHCKLVYPPMFFNILYTNREIFNGSYPQNDIDFLPGVDFVAVFADPTVSDNTREMIWNHLKYVALIISKEVNNSASFGDAEKLFEAIPKEELSGKISDVLKSLTDSKLFKLFTKKSEDSDDEDDTNDSTESKTKTEPDANGFFEGLKTHLDKLMDGKIGSLAKDITNKMSAELNPDGSSNDDVQTSFEKIMREPEKMKSMMNRINDELQERIKSGEIKEAEIIAEGFEFLKILKENGVMPPNFEELLTKFGLGGKKGKSKINIASMERILNARMKTAKLKERIREKAREKAQSQAQTQFASSAVPIQKPLTNDELADLFKPEQKTTSGGGKSKGSSKRK